MTWPSSFPLYAGALMTKIRRESLSESTTPDEKGAQSPCNPSRQGRATACVACCGFASPRGLSVPLTVCPRGMPWACLRQLPLPFDSSCTARSACDENQGLPPTCNTGVTLGPKTHLRQARRVVNSRSRKIRNEGT